MAEYQAQLASVASLADQKLKVEQYKGVLSKIFASSSIDGAKAFIDHMLSDEVPLVISRQLLQSFVVEIKKLPPSVHKQVRWVRLAVGPIQQRRDTWQEAANARSLKSRQI